MNTPISPRLHFSLLTIEDLSELVALNADPAVRAFFPDGVQTRAQTLLRLEQLLENAEKYGCPNFSLRERSSNEFMGRCGFARFSEDSIEVGYILHQKFWGKGYATEALQALFEWAELYLPTKCIWAFAPIEHHQSLRVMEKCGMQFAKTEGAHGVLCHFYKKYLA